MRAKVGEGQEARVAERYSVEAPVAITVDLGDREKTIEGKTLNISSAGAYIVAPKDCLKPGARVHLELLMSIGVLRSVFGLSDRLRIRVGGNVVRIGQGGLAVRFDKTYALKPEKS